MAVIMRAMTKTIPILLALLLFSAPALANKGGKGRTKPQASWLQRGIKKALANKGYGKLRVVGTRPRLALGLTAKPNKTRKPPKWQTAGGVVVDTNTRKVLVVRIRKEAKEGRSGWTWPKGRLDPGEKAPRAAIRETYEETGVQALPVAKIAQLRSNKSLRHYYLMDKLKDTRKFDPKETLEVRWVSLRQAGKLLDRKRDQKVLGAARLAIRELEKAAALP